MFMTRQHWDTIYREKEEQSLSWYQPSGSALSELLENLRLPEHPLIIDVGCGTSRFAEQALERFNARLILTDLSEAALTASRIRLGPIIEESGGAVDFLAGDITCIPLPAGKVDLWHDRAVFHFLLNPADQMAYVEQLRQAVRPGGYVYIETFAPDGPDRCSGLPVQRYSTDELKQLLTPGFQLISSKRYLHTKPDGQTQSFQQVLFCAQPPQQ